MDNNNEISNKNDTTVLNTKEGIKDGQYVCPGCGSSVITFDEETGKLKCAYCRTLFEGKKVDSIETDLSNLTGTKIGAGAQNINKEADDVITLKCNGCGAEVVIDTTHAQSARCHWCRSIISINSKVENGSAPDVVLPFKLKKEEAKTNIEKFVKKRQFFAHPTFKREFTLENVMGVYFPYMLIDANAHSNFSGEGEHLERKYNVGDSDHPDYRYDAKAFHVEREFDITIDDLTVESNSNRMNVSSKDETNNIINSVMPFDTENCVQYRGNYLYGYTSEKRDVDIADLDEKVDKQIKDIARYSINNDLKHYDRGVRWDKEDTEIKGKQWIAAYLPIWLYSYRQVIKNKSLLHYVAVNARTGETMGSIPINKLKLFIVSAIIEFFSGIFALYLMAHMDSDDEGGNFVLLLFTAGFIFYGIMYARYRNQDARHAYENETKTDVTNVRRVDLFIEERKKLKDSKIEGINNYRLDGDNIKNPKGFVDKTVNKYLKSNKK